MLSSAPYISIIYKLKSFSEGAESNQNEVKKIDLYKENFNPVYDLKDDDKNIKNYQNLVTESDVLVFVYPTWWFRAPATAA